MTDRRDFDTLTPEITVLVNGRELPVAAKADLVGISVLEDVEAPSMFTFVLRSWDTAEMKVKWIDDTLVNEGNTVEIQVGYRDKQESIFKGEITGLEPDFDNEKASTLTVCGYDLRHRLMRKRETQSFQNMKDSEIADQLAREAGLGSEVRDSGIRLQYALQHNQTDLEFLEMRARRIGYEVVVADKTLYFRPRKMLESGSKGDVINLSLEVELLEFQPRLSTIGQVQETEVNAWNPKQKDRITARAGGGDEHYAMEGQASGPAVARRAFRKTGSVIVDMPVTSQDEADQLAKAAFAEMALRYIVGHGVCIGQPTLRPGKRVNVVGLGDRFSGLYYVTSAEHVYKPKVGYRTAFSVRRNAS